jgi:hypothetical protein
MKRFSYESLKAIPRFFAYRNEIDVYTEDKCSDKEFYRALFERLTEGKVKINDITPLGCKASVLKAYDEQDNKSERKKLFIVDGDLDLIIGTNRKPERNLVVLDSYCIENYIIDEAAGIEIIYYSDGISDKDNISKRLNFKKWIGYNQIDLINLFINLAILRMYGGGPKLRSASSFLSSDKKQIILDKSAIQIYSDGVKNEIIDLLKNEGYGSPEKLYEVEFNKLIEMWGYSNETLLKIVSGKDYLVHLFQHRINFNIGKSKMMFPKQSFKLFLANHCELKRLDFLKRKMI